MPLVYILILSVLFSIINWTCTILVMTGHRISPVLWAINALVWTFVLICILWAGHQRAKSTGSWWDKNQELRNLTERNTNQAETIDNMRKKWVKAAEESEYWREQYNKAYADYRREVNITVKSSRTIGELREKLREANDNSLWHKRWLEKCEEFNKLSDELKNLKSTVVLIMN